MKRLAILALPLLLAACGGTSTPKVERPSGAVHSEACARAGGGTTPQSSAAKPAETLLLTGVKIDSDTCADRVVFDFRPGGGEEPGYTVEYKPAAEAQTEDASGRHIPIAGNAFLVVRFEPAATADLSGAKFERTYTGPRKIAPAGMNWVQEVAKTGDFEAVLTWTIGLSQKRPFTVTSSGSPARLTIEFG
jgi:hypothetical protein